MNKNVRNHLLVSSAEATHSNKKQDKKKEKPGRKNKLKSRNLMRFRMIKKTYLTVGLCAQQTMES